MYVFCTSCLYILCSTACDNSSGNWLKKLAVLNLTCKLQSVNWPADFTRSLQNKSNQSDVVELIKYSDNSKTKCAITYCCGIWGYFLSNKWSIPGKPRGLRTARKHVNHRREQRWADNDYKKAHLGTRWKANPFGGASHAKGIVLEKVWVYGRVFYFVNNCASLDHQVILNIS